MTFLTVAVLVSMNGGSCDLPLRAPLSWLMWGVLSCAFWPHVSSLEKYLFRSSVHFSNSKLEKFSSLCPLSRESSHEKNYLDGGFV